MKNYSKILYFCVFLIMLLFTQTPNINSIVNSTAIFNQADNSTTFQSNLAANQIDIESTLLNNKTYVNEVLSFLSRSQDKGITSLPSMDIAYYTGMALKTLEQFQSVPDIFTDDLPLIYDQIIKFIASTLNPDGGYSNWKGAKSSIESTFQAISLYSKFNLLSNLPTDTINLTLEFVKSLKTPSGGYFPLPNWDVPDISSTYRSLWVKKVIQASFPTLDFGNDSDVPAFVNNNYVPALFITGASGFSEVYGGKTELLASLYALQTFDLLGIDNQYASNVARYLKSLTALNGGISGLIGKKPTTGFTTIGIRVYDILLNYTSIDLDLILGVNFFQKSIDYIKGNKQLLSGYTSSATDKTPELSSTFFVINLLNELDLSTVETNNFDFNGIYDFIILGRQPTFGFGDSPGDKGDLSYTTMSILVGEMLKNVTWINSGVKTFILDAYNGIASGFGFRPAASARVKYTYYGIKSLRALSYPLSQISGIKTFILNSITSDGGFGQFPDAKLSYLSHTYWALSSLKLMDELNDENINTTSIIEWLSKLKSDNQTYSNSRVSDPTIISTYRAIEIQSMLGKNITNTSNYSAILQSYRRGNGFSNKLDKSYSTMEATYYGVALALKLGIDLDFENILDFILSLRNKDGGFGLRPGFSSRVTSTYFAILSLKLLNQYFQNLELPDEDQGLLDYYGPIIQPSFIPKIDTNRTIQGSYKTSARIDDPETGVVTTWASVAWTPSASIDRSNTTLYQNYTGSNPNTDSNLWIFVIGPFDQKGVIRFRIYAIDAENNTSFTDVFTLISTDISSVPVGAEQIQGFSIIKYIPLIMFVFVSLDASITIINKKRHPGGEIKMTIQYNNQSNSPYSQSINLVLIVLVMLLMSVIARILMADALIIIQNSLFLFRFLLAIIVILIAKYVIGIHSYGLYAPSVLVVSFLSLGPFWGMVIFLNIFALLFLVRSLLSVFNLPVGFRIGIMMVFTITLLGMFELAGEIFRIDFLSNTVFVPIIITPWIIDRFVIDVQQNDHYTAGKKLSYTMIISLLAFILMSNDKLITFIAVNPETWIVLIVFLLYFGKYRTYTQFDKTRFKRLFNSGDDPLTLLIRNRNYITKYNSSVVFPIINKFDMKSQFQEWQVPTPELLAIINHENQLDDLITRLQTEEIFKEGFVIKPSKSFGGLGIIVVQERLAKEEFRIGSEIYHIEAIKKECLKILQGEYLTGQTVSDRDIFIVEEKIICEQNYASISVGMPDIRIIIFRGVPIMAMGRLPTNESDGKANLKQGAIGAAIRISDGVINRAEWKTYKVLIHPDTQNPIVGFKFENWQQILATACLAQKSSSLGYVGVDIILDDKGRILVLEVNKRPGLEIQNINLASLLERMTYLEESDIDMMSKSPIKAARKGIELSSQLWEKEEE